MELKHTVGKHELKIVVDEDELRKAIDDDRKWCDDCSYVRPYTYSDDAGYLTEAEYMANIDAMHDKLTELMTKESLIEMIESAPKKKDGTFAKGRVTCRHGSDNSSYICEWHNTWIYGALTVKAEDSHTLVMSYTEYVDTPG